LRNVSKNKNVEFSHNLKWYIIRISFERVLRNIQKNLLYSIGNYTQNTQIFIVIILLYVCSSVQKFCSYETSKECSWWEQQNNYGIFISNEEHFKWMYSFRLWRRILSRFLSPRLLPLVQQISTMKKRYRR
jgi:hypothetical protein